MVATENGVGTSTKSPRSAKIHPGPGFRIRTDRPSPPEGFLDRLKAFEIPDISDALNRLYALESGIQPQNRDVPLICAPVTTVRVFPGDNLMVHKVLDVAQPGDIVVIAGHGNQSMNAIIGDMICNKAHHRGIAGFVVDGLVRDMPGVDEIPFPVWARGTTAVGPLQRGPGEINYPVACGGVVVNPGDVLIADVTGAVVVPREHLEDLVLKLEEQRTKIDPYAEGVRMGDFSNAWADELLAQAGCLIE